MREREHEDMRQMLCYLKAIPFYMRTGIWCPHIYEETNRYKAIVIADNKSFRVSDNLLHRDDETVHPNAMVIQCKCTCCGSKEVSWYEREPEIIRN